MHWEGNAVITCNHKPMHSCMCLGRDFSYTFRLHRITLQSFTYEVEDGTRGNILVNLIYAILVFTPCKLDHAFCVLKHRVNFFSTLLFSELITMSSLARSYPTKEVVIFFLLYGNYYTLYNYLFLFVSPHQTEGNFVYPLPSAVPGR